MTIRDDVRKYFEHEAARHEAPRGFRAAALGEARGRALERRSPQWIAGAIAVVLAVAVVAALLGADVFLRSHGAPANPRSSAARTASPTSSPGSSTPLDSVAMFGDNGWASTLDSGGGIANVLRSADGGRTWRTVTPGGVRSSSIFGFAAIDVNRAWLTAVGPSQQGYGPVDLWATVDGGQTWSKTTAPAFVFRGPLITFTDGMHGWFAVPGEPSSQEEQQGIVIDRTLDGGKTWQLVAETNYPPVKSTSGAPPFTCGKSDLSFLDASTGWLTGSCTAGITFDLTTDGGVTWKVEPLASPDGAPFSAECGGGPCTLTAPRFISPGFGYMMFEDTSTSGNRSWLYVSGDGGRSWTIHRVPGQAVTVAMVTASVGFASVLAVDSAGGFDPAADWLYRTDDGGKSWQPVAAGVHLLYASLDCVSASRCWALSRSPIDSSTQLYETTDSGLTWSNLKVQVP
jgi:photosystem II stability/assembly factor-like uncharacterized protein